MPVNDIGSLADLSTLAAAGIARVEVLRQPSSVLYGSDLVSGVVSLTSARGSSPLPLLTYAVDGGNFGTLHQEVSVAGARSRLDYDTGFAAFQTSNNLVDDQFHNSTVFGNYGFDPAANTDLRFTFRHIDTNSGNPTPSPSTASQTSSTSSTGRPSLTEPPSNNPRRAGTTSPATAGRRSTTIASSMRPTEL